MIQWIHTRGKDWGRWRNRDDSAWPRESLLSRIRNEGSVGAAIKQHGQHVPVKLMPREIAEFHRAVMSMDESCRAVVEVVYRTKAGRDEKAEMLGISKSRMYQLLDQAHGYLAGRLDGHPKEMSRLSNNYTVQTVK